MFEKCHIRYHPQKKVSWVQKPAWLSKHWWMLKPRPHLLCTSAPSSHSSKQPEKAPPFIRGFHLPSTNICSSGSLALPPLTAARPDAPRATRDLTRAHGGSVNRAGANRTLPGPHRVPFRCRTRLRAVAQTAFSVTDGGRSWPDGIATAKSLVVWSKGQIKLLNSWFTCKIGPYFEKNSSSQIKPSIFTQTSDFWATQKEMMRRIWEVTSCCDKINRIEAVHKPHELYFNFMQNSSILY